MVKKEIVLLENQLLKNASEIILSNYGLDFSNEKLRDLNSALIKLAKESGNKSPLELTQLLINNKLTEDDLDLLLVNLTVGETFFFRDEKLFTALQSKKIKEFIYNKSYINIWSAGCASGEEPYSIAILLDKFYKNNSGTKFKIHASDINKHSIEKAKKGFYRNWSFRSTPDWVKKEYFNERGEGVYEIKEAIKNKVEFSIINLSATEKIKNYSPSFDIIICRNVLIYFSKPVVKNLLEIIYHKINNSGLFITTASESININKSLFSKFIEGNNTIFIKGKVNTAEIVEFPKTKLKVVRKEPAEIRNKPKKKEIEKKKISKEINLNIIYKDAVNKYENEKYAEALILFEKIEHELNFSKEKIKDEAEFFFYLIKNHMKLGKVKKANHICDESLKKEKLDFRFHYLHGILLQENGDFENAEAAFNKSIYLNNKFPLSYFSLANLQLSAGKNSYKKNFQKSAKLVWDLKSDEIVKYSDGIIAGDLLKQIALLTE